MDKSGRTQSLHRRLYQLHTRARASLIERRAAVREKLIDQDTEGLSKLSPGRDQILARLWYLANLKPEATRGRIASQIKARL